jgi:hypothetical protein
MATMGQSSVAPSWSRPPAGSGLEEAGNEQRLVRRLTGASALTAGVIGTALGPLYFMYSGAPPTWNVLTRNLLNLLAVGAVIVFLAGLRALLRQADAAAYEWLASLVFGAGMVYAAINLVKVSLETGVVLGAPDGTLDPTTDGPVAHANILLHGSVDRLVTALLLTAAGSAILRTRALPRWAGTSAYALAVVNLAFVPSLYFGIDATAFYSALGWGNTALTAGLFLYWVAAVGIAALLPTRRRARSPRHAASSGSSDG